MPSNARLGMTLQQRICDKYSLIPNKKADSQFFAGYKEEFEDAIDVLIENIFAELALEPVECLTYAPSGKKGETLSPHNFVLSDGSTLSVRTNMNGAKVAPRVVGQCGLKVFNEHFSDIVKTKVTDKEQIKKVIFKKIHKMLPKFVDYMFVSDYTVWCYFNSEGKLEYKVFDSSKVVDLDFKYKNFKFTRDLAKWNVSTTLKYGDVSLAEIEIPKNRTFIFRFNMSALADLLVEKKRTTETLGISAEVAICEQFGIPIPPEYSGRYDAKLVDKVKPTIQQAFKSNSLPPAIRSTGAKAGSRGGNSKCSYDFVLDGDLKLSLKTNTGKMVCPPEVGQPGAETCLSYFNQFTTATEMTGDVFKEMVYEHIDEMMEIYVSHLFDSDHLLWVYKNGNSFVYKIYNSDFAKNFHWDKDKFTFTKHSKADWVESNTVKYNKISIGEFQVHRARSCYKFRFNLLNFEKLINKYNEGSTDEAE